MSKRVLITGGSRGIGHALVTHFTQASYTVLAPSRAELDLSTPATIRSFLTAGGAEHIDILINNAGINLISETEHITQEQWDRQQCVNVTAPFLLLQHVIPYMKAQQWGRVVNISSCYSIVSRPGRLSYSTTKAGINGLTRAAALELAPHHILVNAVAPGFVQTEMTSTNNTPEQLQLIREQIPLRRLADPVEIARFVAFLCSEENTYITGQTIAIDGGFTIA